jgi:hypothetical protein
MDCCCWAEWRMDSKLQSADCRLLLGVGPQGSNENFSGVFAGEKLIAITIYGKIIGVVRPRRLNVASPLSAPPPNALPRLTQRRPPSTSREAAALPCPRPFCTVGAGLPSSSTLGSRCALLFPLFYFLTSDVRPYEVGAYDDSYVHTNSIEAASCQLTASRWLTADPDLFTCK